MAGRRFNKRNPGNGKFAKGGVVINGRKKKPLSKKARSAKNKAAHAAKRQGHRAVVKANRPKTAKAIMSAASGAVAAYIAYESLRDTPLGKQVDTEIRSRIRFRKQAPRGSKANGNPFKKQKTAGTTDRSWSNIQTSPLGSNVKVRGG